MNKIHYLIIMLLILWGILLPVLFMDKVVEPPKQVKPVLCYNELQETIKFRGRLQAIHICLDYNEPLLVRNDSLVSVPYHLKQIVNKITDHYE